MTPIPHLPASPEEERLALALLCANLPVRAQAQILGDVMSGALTPAQARTGPALDQRYRLPRAKAQAVALPAGGDDPMTAQQQRLAAAGVRVLCLGRADYPHHLRARLRDAAPPILLARGEVALLQRPAVGFCGSRKASPKGLAIAATCAGALAAEGINIISGHAAGVDLAVHAAALTPSGSGATTLVLPEGILGLRLKAPLAATSAGPRLLILSQFAPTASWSVGNAMTRNRTLLALADAMVLIESGETGGTHAAGEDTLALGLPLFAVDFAAPPPSAAGNGAFLARGARPLRGRPDGTPSLGELRAVVARAHAERALAR